MERHPMPKYVKGETDPSIRLAELEDEIRSPRGETAAEVFRFDVDALHTVTDRVGPAMAKVRGA
jgi:hypothetical protein